MRQLVLLPFVAGGLIACAREPMSGEYRLERIGEVAGDCVFERDSEVLAHTDRIADVVIGPGGDAMNIRAAGKDTPCVRDGNDFECTFLEEREEGDDVTISTTLVGIGTWTSDRAFEGTMEYVSTCEGLGCARLIDEGRQFCNATWDWSGRMQGEGRL